ncbi:choline dehydrogenase protein [Rutstroemia sp. NJR-2017a BBW]|nr:choline dehydrogenase protein [Rutstroemia sp. NJR-2017a BBW]
MGKMLLKSSLWCLALFCCGRVVSSDNLREQPTLAERYDYIIVGGGTSGLVVANRLSEDPRKTVLVIEHGLIDNSSLTLVPRLGMQYFPNNVKNWGYTSAPVRSLKNGSFTVYAADVVGGSSLHNGMFADRGSKADYDGWGIIAGNDTWGWSGLYPYFVKSTKFHPPSAELTKEFNIKNNASAYGDGPIQISFPSLIFPDLRNQTLAANAYGIATADSPESGDAIGLYWVPQTLDYAKGTRSHSRVAYYDPVAGRPNLQLVTGALVEEILFSGDLSATGVRVNFLAQNKTIRVSASREVILAAGSIGTPKLLQLSGIGPKNSLRAAGVKVKLDKPAVGANLQDHPAGSGRWNVTNLAFPNDNTLTTNTTYNASAWDEYVLKHTGPYSVGVSPTAAFLPLSHYSSRSQEIIKRVQSQNPSNYLPSVYKDEALLKGYLAQRAVIVDHFGRTDAAAIEITLGTTGPGTCVVEKPLSRGTVTLNSTNPSGQPIVQFNAFENAVDATLLAECVLYVRGFYEQPQLASYYPKETLPGVNATSDDEIFTTLVNNGLVTPSIAHPSGTCALGLERQGGCVGADLLVYGTKRLSVVDASIMPLIPATHLQLTVYAVAEKASDIIKARH